MTKTKKAKTIQPYALPYTLEDLGLKRDNITELGMLGFYIPLILNMCEKYYPPLKDKHKVVLEGIMRGLRDYHTNLEKRKDTTILAPYLTWYMKTAVEYELGYDNEDTQAWKKGMKKRIRKSPLRPPKAS